jgi:serine/threonine-protein kinase
MNKKILITVSSVFILVGLYFFSNVGLKFFFNDYLYETPNVKGLTVKEGEDLLQDNFKLVVMGEDYSELKKGAIYSQLPESPKQIKHGRPIKIWVSKGMDSVELPVLIGKSLQDARVELNDLGLRVDNISHTTDGKVNNIVLGSDPQGGTTISRGATISLLVNISKADNVRMPDILGYSIKEGSRVLRSKKLVVGNVTKVYNTEFPEGTIIDVSYSAGKRILAGSTIDVTIATESEGE